MTNEDEMTPDEFRKAMTEGIPARLKPGPGPEVVIVTDIGFDPDTPGCDGGLPLEERLDPDKKPTKAPPEAHQLWVWFRGMKPPRWEIRGTGAMLPDGWPTRHGPYRSKE